MSSYQVELHLLIYQIFEFKFGGCVQGCMYTCAIATVDGQRLYASSTDQKIKELEEVSGTGMQITKEFDTGCILTQLLLAQGMPPDASCSD